MAKRKGRKKAATRRAPAKPSRTRRRKKDLGAFFRWLWAKPENLRRFAAGGEERAEVIDAFGPSPRHRALLMSGCVRDVIAELAGAEPGENSTIVQETDSVTCGHAECLAFAEVVGRK